MAAYFVCGATSFTRYGTHTFLRRAGIPIHISLLNVKNNSVCNNNNKNKNKKKGITKYCCTSKLWLLLYSFCTILKAISLSVVIVVVVLPLLSTRIRQFKHLRMTIINVYYCLCWLKHIIIVVVVFFLFWYQ